MSKQEEKPIQITEQEADKLDKLKNIPTLQDDIFTMSSEGMTLFDVVSMFMGGMSKDELAILERTNFENKEECSIVAELLYVSRYGLMCDGIAPTEWAIPELKDRVLLILRGRPSVKGKSREEAKDALQQIKLKLETQPRNLSQV